jgi:formylglycine-generating enzyme required for sulfatase activity
MSKLFISYRRDDSADVTGRLHDRLKSRFGSEAVFLDVDAIPLGVDFRKSLTDAVNQCDVLLAVIGDHWLDASFPDGPRKDTRRLDDDEDYVRIEIEAALARGIPVVPLLVGQTAMPRAADLPEGLKELAYRNAAIVRSGPDFQGQMDRLIRGLEQLLARKQELREGVRKAIHIASEDPKMALGRARMVLELMVRDVYERRFHEPPGLQSLENLVQRLAHEGGLPDQFDLAGMVRRLGSAGGVRWGETESIPAGDVQQSLARLTDILKWYIAVEQPDALGQPPSRRGEPEPRASTAAAPSRPPGRGAPIAVVPKGLRSFDANDAGFFLELVPGPRDENGLPESIRFWKHRIEAGDELTFTVGVIYGPSGCGKSSLVKAGLLPRLAGRVVSVYVEATAGETEARLLKGLRKRFPDLPGELDLTGTLAALRQGQGLSPGRQLLVVLDQFEQWLHARRGESDPELARALRQCDGEHVQCIVLVRDDFWVALTRFLAELRIEILQGRNAALVDLFDPIHARTVLAGFGKAYGRLPADDPAITRDQESFLAQTIAGLARDGRVIPIRLAVFAEMVKGRTWTPATLKEVGGTQGVGVAFLEETFSAAALNVHQKAAQGILKALLPESGTTIKGHMRSHEDLAAASGYGSRPRELDNLLWTLDHEVRLITPTDPEGSSGEVSVVPELKSEPSSVTPTGQPPERYYQLTHDYLVPSLREWLTRKQRETRRGRAELRLADRAALWDAKPENRHLPSVLEWANIRLLTKKRDWTQPQRRMMRRASRLHGLRMFRLAVLAGLLTWAGIEGYGYLRAYALVESLRTANTTGVPALIDQLRSYRRWVAGPLAGLLSSTENDRDPHLRASLASLALLPDDGRQARYLHDQLLIASPVELPVILGILHQHDPGIEQRLWPLLENPQSDPEQRFRAACALAGSGSAPVEKSWDTVSPFITERFLAAVIKNPGDYATLIETLRPIRRRLLKPLGSIFRDGGRSESERTFATTLLADYASDDPGLLAGMLMDSGPKAFASLFPVAEQQAAGAIPVLQAEIRERLVTDENQPGSEQLKDALAQRQARAAVALIRLGHAGEVWPLLRHSADPRLRSFLVNWLNPLGADPKTLAAELARLDSSPRPAQRGEGGRRPGEGSSMDAILFHPETSTRRALILALGTYGAESLSPGEREPLIARLLDLYEHDPDAGIHGAAEWTLRQWQQPAKVDEIDQKLKGNDRGYRRWYVNGQGQTFVKIEGPVEFRMGSPPADPERFGNEPLHQQSIPRGFAIAAKEVTVAQYQEFLKQNPKIARREIDRYSPEPTGPMNGMTWYEAAAFCNWLSREENLPECYEPNSSGEFARGMRIKADALKRNGYRLPTEAEWEYACRAGAGTSRYYGLSTELLEKYAWYQANSKERAWPSGSLLPNDLGLFDMLGNVYEWCQERYSDKPGGEASPSDDIIDESNRLLRGGATPFPPAFVRSPDRYRGAPSNRLTPDGFRPSRTYD